MSKELKQVIEELKNITLDLSVGLQRPKYASIVHLTDLKSKLEILDSTSTLLKNKAAILEEENLVRKEREKEITRKSITVGPASKVLFGRAKDYEKEDDDGVESKQERIDKEDFDNKDNAEKEVENMVDDYERNYDSYEGSGEY